MSVQGDGTCPCPATCPGLPGHAGTCLAVRSALSVLTLPRDRKPDFYFYSGMLSLSTGVAQGLSVAPGLGTPQLPTGTPCWQ